MKPFHPQRRKLLTAGATLAAAAAGMPGIVRAQSKELVVAGPAQLDALVSKDILDDFERRYGCKIIYDGSSSLENLRKLQASKDKPPMSVLIIDDPIMLAAAEQNLIEQLPASSVPNMSSLSGSAVMRNGLWVHYKWPTVSIGYNTKLLPNGVPSWTDLWSPAAKGRVMIPSFSSTVAPMLLAMAAHLETGVPLASALDKADAGFEKLKALKPNLLTIFNQSSQVQSLLETGEATYAACLLSAYTLARQAAGAPIGLARPKEGMFALGNAMAVTRNAANRELALTFINEMLGLDYQTKIMKLLRDTPTNTRVKVEGVPLAKDLVVLDSAVIARNRATWTRRFDQEIAA